MAVEVTSLPRVAARGSFALSLRYGNARPPNDLDVVSADESSLPHIDTAIDRVSAEYQLTVTRSPRQVHADGQAWFHRSICDQTGRVVLGVDFNCGNTYETGLDFAAKVDGIRCLSLELLLAEKMIRLVRENPTSAFYGRWPASHLRILIGQPVRRCIGQPRRNAYVGDVYDLWWGRKSHPIDIGKLRIFFDLRRNEYTGTLRTLSELITPVQRKSIHLYWRYSLAGRVPMIPTAERAMRAAFALGRQVSSCTANGQSANIADLQN